MFPVFTSNINQECGQARWRPEGSGLGALTPWFPEPMPIPKAFQSALTPHSRNGTVIEGCSDPLVPRAGVYSERALTPISGQNRLTEALTPIPPKTTRFPRFP